MVGVRGQEQEALDHVWAAQCSCGYWHGVFGGVYLGHIRAANYAHLLAAEEIETVRSGSCRSWLAT